LVWPNNPLTWYKVPRNQPVSWYHLLGTTNLGQDIFWLLTWALQNSLLLGLSVAFFSTLIGVFAGLAAGYFGGWIDRVLSFLMDALLCIPSLPILILLAALFGGQLSLINVGLALVLFNWPYPGRQVRAVALSIREREFIYMAWFSGESPFRILSRHIFPYIAGWSAANFINTVLVDVATETSLAVIGFSSSQQATIGTMLIGRLNIRRCFRSGMFGSAPRCSRLSCYLSLFLISSGLSIRSAARRLGT
jgi:peptide/nickel transport system permease protein